MLWVYGLRNGLHNCYAKLCELKIFLCQGELLGASVTLHLQVSVQLPNTVMNASEQHDCYAPAMHWADNFWSVCLQR